MTLYITGASADGTYFVDQNSNPRLFVGEDIWNIGFCAGQWNSGNYQATFDTYFSQRAAQGYTAAEVMTFSCDNPGNTNAFNDGRDWDGVWPFNSTSDPSSGFNATFWARRDYMITSAAANGITVILNVTTTNAGKVGVINNTWTNTQWTDFGTGLGTWAAGKYPNMFWILGDDYFGNLDTQFNLMRTAILAAGDVRLLTIMNMQETTSRFGFNPTHAADPNSFDIHAQYDWVYTYNPSYNGITYAQRYEPSGTDDVQGPIPPVWADGFYLASGVGSGQTDVRLERQNIWWALSSGAAGVSTGDNDVYVWGSPSAGLVTSKVFYSSWMPAITSAFSGLSGWQKLVSDWNSTLVTSGRGTPATDVATGSNGYINNTDSYVTASYAADGSLAVIYCAKAFSITVNQSLLTPGYGAYWLDPVTGTKTATTAGSSYNSAAPGNNSAGDPDWVLVLAAPPYATWQVP